MRSSTRRGRPDLLSDEHFTVDGTLLEAWASLKSFRPQGRRADGAAGRSGQSDGQFPRRIAAQRHPSVDHGSRRAAGPQGERPRGQAVVRGPRAARQSPWPGRQCLRDRRDRHGRTRGRPAAPGEAPDAVTVGGDKGFDVRQLCRGGPRARRHAARRPEGRRAARSTAGRPGTRATRSVNGNGS